MSLTPATKEATVNAWNKFYVTTAIDYPNALPHNGTAFEKVGADVYARFHRFCGFNSFLLMGNDENTVKVIKATPEGQDTRQYVNNMAVAFMHQWQALGIDYSAFIQTSGERHKVGVEKFINAVWASGYIEKRPFTSLYCDGCEEFKTTKSLDFARRCPNHTNTPVHEVTEENYFFKLSAFTDRLKELYTNYKIGIKPDARRNEMLELIDAGLEDMSISRVNRGWGILVPWDHSQTIYVWFDALLSYMTGVGFGWDETMFRNLWPANVHVIGKDITRFHCLLWPAMIMAYNEAVTEPERVALPKEVFSHGFIYRKKGHELVRESKSDADSQLGPLVDEFGAEAYRYYFMAKCPFGADGEYSRDHIREVYNADLANNLGNLVNRTIQMIVKYGGGTLPAGTVAPAWLTPKVLVDFRADMVSFNYRAALTTIWNILHRANEYIEKNKPWELAKTDQGRCLDVLRDLAAALRIVSLMLKPFMPGTAAKIAAALGLKKWPEMTFGDLANIAYYNGDGLGEVHVEPIQPLFPRSVAPVPEKPKGQGKNKGPAATERPAGEA
jgi:methionyl-tRNA synthetase